MYIKGKIHYGLIFFIDSLIALLYYLSDCVQPVIILTMVYNYYDFLNAFIGLTVNYYFYYYLNIEFHYLFIWHRFLHR